MALIPLVVATIRMLNVAERYMWNEKREQQFAEADVLSRQIEQVDEQALISLRSLLYEYKIYLATLPDTREKNTDVQTLGALETALNRTFDELSWVRIMLRTEGSSPILVNRLQTNCETLENTWDTMLEDSQQWEQERASAQLVVCGHAVFRLFGIKTFYRKAISVFGILDVSIFNEIIQARTKKGEIILIVQKAQNGKGPFQILASSDISVYKVGQPYNHPFIKESQTVQKVYDAQYPDGRKRRVLGITKPLQMGELFLVIEKDADLALFILHEIRNTAIKWGSIVGLVLIVFAVLVGIATSRPISNLAEVTYRIARERAFHIRIRESGFQEVRRLVAAYNTLLNEIQKYVRQVEEKARENKELFYNTIRMITAAIDTKDPYTRGHSERVSIYAKTIAEYMDLSPEDVEKVHISGLLHDVGKIGIQDRILQKPAALTDEEYEIMKTHPEKGYKIMREVVQLKDVVPGMRYHHESWDGSGYPFGLKGEEIPLVARIIAVADSFDAMTTNRPYQRKMSLEKAVERIVLLSGKRFDPRVVQAFIRAYENNAIKIIEETTSVEEAIDMGGLHEASRGIQKQ